MINNTPRVVALPPLRHASFRLSATTRGVLFISLAANGLHELLAIGHLVTGTESRFQFWPFCFERVRRSHCPADEWERRHSEWFPFKHSRCCAGGPATSFEAPVKTKLVKIEKIWNFWKPFSMVVKFWKLSASSFWQTISNDLKLHIRVDAHQGNYLWLLVTFRKVPQKKVMASWNTRILMKMLSGRSNFVPQKLSKKWKVLEKQKHTS